MDDEKKQTPRLWVKKLQDEEAHIQRKIKGRCSALDKRHPEFHAVDQIISRLRELVERERADKDIVTCSMISLTLRSLLVKANIARAEKGLHPLQFKASKGFAYELAFKEGWLASKCGNTEDLVR